MISNKRALAIVALFILSVVIKSSLSSPTVQDFRSINLHRRQAPNQPQADGAKGDNKVPETP
jgi:hypothetical protein